MIMGCDHFFRIGPIRKKLPIRCNKPGRFGGVVGAGGAGEAVGAGGGGVGAGVGAFRYVGVGWR